MRWAIGAAIAATVYLFANAAAAGNGQLDSNGEPRSSYIPVLPGPQTYQDDTKVLFGDDGDCWLVLDTGTSLLTLDCTAAGLLINAPTQVDAQFGIIADDTCSTWGAGEETDSCAKWSSLTDELEISTPGGAIRFLGTTYFSFPVILPTNSYHGGLFDTPVYGGTPGNAVGTCLYKMSEGCALNAAATIDTTGSNVEKATVTVTGKLTVTERVIRTRHWLDHNFMGSSVLYSAGHFDITNAVDLGTDGSNAVGGLGGNALLVSGSNAADCQSSWSNDAAMGRSISPHLHTHTQLDTDLTDKEWRFGLTDNPAGCTGEAGATDYVIVAFDYSADNVLFRLHCSDAVDADLSAGPTAGTLHAVDLDINTDGDATVTLDGTEIGTIAGCVDADTAMYYGFSIASEGAATESITVNHFAADWTHP